MRNLKLWRLTPLLLVFATFAYAADQADLPITVTAGKPGCATCKTTPGGVNPIANSDLPNQSSAEVAGHVTDETGTGLMCFATSPTLTTPTIAGATHTGTQDFTGATVNFGASAIDAITEIHSNLRSGNGTKLCTTTGTLTNGHMVVIDANGNCVDGGVPSTGTKAVVNMESQFPIPAGDTNTFVSAGSNISATAANAASLTIENMTLGSPCCWYYTAAPGTSMVLTLQKATAPGGSFSSTTVTVSLTAANTAVCDSTHSAALSAGEVYTLKVDGDSGTAEGQIRGGCVRTL